MPERVNYRVRGGPDARLRQHPAGERAGPAMGRPDVSPVIAWGPYTLTWPELAHDLRKAGLPRDAFGAGLGTGGTMGGAGKYLKELFPQSRNVGVDPDGSVYLDYF